MNYLLPAQTLLDIISAGLMPAHQWAATVDTRSLRISVISIAQAKAEIMAVSNAGERSRVDSDFTALLAQLRADAGPPLAFDEPHAMTWQALMFDKSISGIPQSDRMVYATAMYEGLTVVEAARTATPALQALGVSIVVI